MSLRVRLLLPAIRRYSQTAQNSSAGKPPGPGTSSPQGINENVPGLSSRCVKPTTGPVGPGASTSGEYKVPEYFCFSKISYAEAEVEMAKYRCPQPSALKH